MAADQIFVIVGASLCGAKAADTLRKDGFDGRVLLLGAEPDRPYERPPLSKTYLRGESPFDDAAVHDLDDYDAKGIELRLSTTVTRFDPAASVVEIASGEQISYDRLLLATGAAPRRLSIPGSELAGIHYLRTVRDADAIHDAVTSSVPVVVIGAGWIGAEVAASSRQLGAEVTMIDLASVPLERVMGTEVGGVYRDLHAAHGVQLRLGVGIESIGGNGTVEEVRLSDGSVVPAGAVVVGVGVTPRTELAEEAGLEVENGVVTDSYLATSAPGVYAAGDVADALHPLYDERIRLEHWSAALNQGPTAAKNMLGEATPYDKTPYFYSDQYELSMEYRGWAPDFDEVVFRGDPASGAFLSFWLHRGRVVAGMNANVWDETEAIESLVRKRRVVEPAKLADPDVELAALADAP